MIADWLTFCFLGVIVCLLRRVFACCLVVCLFVCLFDLFGCLIVCVLFCLCVCLFIMYFPSWELGKLPQGDINSQSLSYKHWSNVYDYEVYKSRNCDSVNIDVSPHSSHGELSG